MNKGKSNEDKVSAILSTTSDIIGAPPLQKDRYFSSGSFHRGFDEDLHRSDLHTHTMLEEKGNRK